LNKAKSVGHRHGGAKREVYRNTGLPQERRTIPYEQSKLKTITTRERRTNAAHSQQEEEHNTDWSRNK